MMAYLTSGRNKIMGSSVSTDANVVTVIDDTCTDEQVPSALATKAYVDNNKVKISAEENNKIEIKDDGIFVSKDYVEITQAEYDLLTEEEKKDIVFYIKDATSARGLATVIDENSTDEEIPSAKAVHTAIQNVSVGVPADVYSKTEVDDLLADKADSTDIIDAYTKTEVDTLLANKANTSAIIDAYSKTEVNDLLYDKANVDDIIDAYTKTEVDGLLNAKVDSANIVTTLSSSSTDTQIPSAKTVFDAIESVSAGVPADVYSKTDVDDLLANKADTSAIIDAYTKTEVNNLMDAKANANDVYAKTDVDDLLSTKADSADIIDAYTKEEVDDLLADKADSSSLIDAYTKEEVNTLLDDKVNTDDLVDAYSKEEVNNLLNAKADSSDVADLYTKEEIDDLLADKANSSAIVDAYTKTEVDGLLANKVDTDDLVDSYSKTEVDDLLADKANTSAIIDAYTKTEVDTLLTGKADSSAIIDAYTKEEVNDLLDSKADSSSIIDAYNKTEVDDLLADKADTTALEQLEDALTDYPTLEYLEEVKTELENEISNIPIVTKTSDLTNDSGFITANDIPDVDLEPYALKTQIPTTLPASDVYDWAKASTKPTYTASEVGALASNGTAVNASKVSNALTLQIAGTTKNTFDGSSAQTFNIPNASTSAPGVMTTAQVTKLNGIATGATKNTIDTAMSSTSTNAVQNKVIYAYIQNQLKNAGDYVGKTMIDVGGADAGTSNGYTYTNSKGGFADITLWSNHCTDNNLYIIVDGVTVMSSARPSTSLKRVDTSGDYEVYELKIPFTSTFNITHYAEEDEYEYSIVRGFIYVNK